MQFGVFTVGDVTPDPTTAQVPSEHERIKSMVAIAVKAEEVGLDVLATGEHQPLDPLECRARGVGVEDRRYEERHEAGAREGTHVRDVEGDAFPTAVGAPRRAHRAGGARGPRPTFQRRALSQLQRRQHGRVWRQHQRRG